MVKHILEVLLAPSCDVGKSQNLATCHPKIKSSYIYIIYFQYQGIIHVQYYYKLIFNIDIIVL